MAPGTHEYRVFIRESHLDTFGHVNNATYLTLFEEARWDLITGRGYGIDTIRATRLGPVILEANVKFRREVVNRETVIITTSLLSYEGKIGKLRQRLTKEDGSLGCEAIFVCALWDIDARKLVAPTPEWAHAVFLDERHPGADE
jgi:acyl-CoA thioester hydrolase